MRGRPVLEEDHVVVVLVVLWIVLGPVFIAIALLVVLITQVYDYFKKRKRKP